MDREVFLGWIGLDRWVGCGVARMERGEGDGMGVGVFCGRVLCGCIAELIRTRMRIGMGLIGLFKMGKRDWIG